MTTIPLPGPPKSAEEPFLRVGSSTNPQSLANAIAHAVLDGGRRPVILRAVGAGAVNQAIKASAIARGLVASTGVDLTLRPGFANVPGREAGKEISAIKLEVIVS